MKRKMAILLLGFLVVCSFNFVSQSEATDLAAGVDVLILVATDFGWDYFEARPYFESWGANVKVVSHTLDYFVEACSNFGTNNLTSDYLTSELNESLLATFDCLYIPSGAHWNGLVASTTVLNWISTAYELGLVIGTQCIGNRVLARANNIVNGTMVAYYGITYTEMVNEGAIVTTARVVSDNRIVTGGAGSGFPAGYEGAPTYELCSMMIKEVTGVSPIADEQISPAIGTNISEFSLQLSIDNITESFPLINQTDVHEATALLYHPDSRHDFVEIDLTEDSGVFSTSLSNLTVGEYCIDITIRYTNLLLMVYREVVSFEVLDELPPTTTSTTATTESSIGTSTSTSSATTPTTTPPSPDILLPVIAISSVVVIVILVVAMKRK